MWLNKDFLFYGERDGKREREKDKLKKKILN